MNFQLVKTIRLSTHIDIFDKKIQIFLGGDQKFKKVLFVFYDVESPENFIFENQFIENAKGHFSFNRHFLKSIFDLLILNRFPNVFSHRTRRGPNKSLNGFCTLPTTQQTFSFFIPHFSPISHI